MYRITSAVVTDYKRVRDVTITPSADRSIILIAGRNMQGKSSVLDALSSAIGGKGEIDADPVRHGAEHAEIRIVYDNGALTVRRKIKPDGSSSLEVRGAEGPIRSPQTMLDQLIGDRFLDPIAFLNLPKSAQRATVIKIVDKENRLEVLEQKREANYDKRTELGREVKRATVELASAEEMLASATAVEPVDVAELAARRAAFSEVQRKNEAMHKDVSGARQSLARARALADQGAAAIAELERQLAERRAEHVKSEKLVRDLEVEFSEAEAMLADVIKHWEAGTAMREETDRLLAQADVINRQAFEWRSANDRKAAAKAAWERFVAEHAAVETTLEKIERRKTDIIGAAKLPIPNLGITREGITLNGHPFDQASGAERLRTALALAVAASPNLRDIWVRDGALLDDDSLELVAKHAEETGHTVWIERVGTRDAGAIVIEDGMVKP